MTKEPLNRKDRAQFLRNLIETPGWKIIEEFCAERLATLTTQLKNYPCEHGDYLRGQIKELDTVLNEVRRGAVYDERHHGGDGSS